jgi:hypothetical protein
MPLRPIRRTPLSRSRGTTGADAAADSDLRRLPCFPSST